MLAAWWLSAQPAGDTKLKQVIIFGRHSVRSPVMPKRVLDTLSARPFPVLGVAPGLLTESGAALQTILGRYYRRWLT